MKGTGTDATFLQNNISITPTNRVIAELNQNRYNDFDQDYVDANESIYYPSTVSGYNKEFYKQNFPVDSVVNPVRPISTGMCPARKMGSNAKTFRPYNVLRGIKSMNHYNSVTGASYGSTGPTANATPQYFYDTTNNFYTPNPRLYYPGPGIKYKNYTQVSTSKLSETADSERWSKFSVDIKYKTDFWCNRITLGFETTMGDPSYKYGGGSGLSIAVLVSPDNVSGATGGTWQDIGINPRVDSNGRVHVYRTTTGSTNTVGTWTATQPAYGTTNGDTYWSVGSDVISNAVKIYGIRVTCNTPRGPVVLIEVKPCLAADITHRLMSWSWNANLAEQDSLHPIGTVSANTGSLKFFNSDDSGQNISMVMSDSNRSDTECRVAEFSRQYCQLKGHVTVSPGSTSDIPQFTAFASSWDDSSVNTIEAQSYDLIGLMQEMEAPEFMIEGASVSQVLWRLFDMVGIGPVRIKKSNYELLDPTSELYKAEDICTVAYTDKDQNLWDFVKEICADFRYSVYVDESGYITIATRNYLFDISRAAAWTFYGQDSGTGPFADIKTLNVTKSDSLNTVSFKYNAVKKISADDDVDKNLSGSQVAKITRTTRNLWRPQKEVLLGMATLFQEIDDTSTDYLWVYGDIFANAEWDKYSGYVLVDKEIIKYDGSLFSYIDSSTSKTNYKVIKNIDEFTEVKSHALGAVSFTGKFMNLKRGQFGTTAAVHTPSISSLSSTISSVTGNGSFVTYTSDHTFRTGDIVNITGISPSGYNAVDAPVVSTAGNKKAKILRASGTAGVMTYYAQNNFVAGEKINISGISPSAYNGTGLTVRTATSGKFTVSGSATAKFSYTASTSAKAVKNGYFTISNTTTAAVTSLTSAKAARDSLWKAPTTNLGIITRVRERYVPTGTIRTYLRLNSSHGAAGTRYTAYKKLSTTGNTHFFCSMIPQDSKRDNSGGMVIYPQINSSNVVTGGVMIDVFQGGVTDKKIKTANLFISITLNGSGISTADRSKIKFFNLHTKIGSQIELWANVQSLNSKTNRLHLSINKGHKLGYFDFPKSYFSNKGGMAIFSTGTSSIKFDYAGASDYEKATDSTYMTSINSLMSTILSTKTNPKKISNIEIDRFDESVREIYYNKVKFDTGPARNVSWWPYANSDIRRAVESGKDTLIAKDGDVAYAISNQSPWHAEVFLANVSSKPVLLSTDKGSAYPLIYGEVYEKGGEQNVIKDDKESIRRLGIKKFESNLSWVNNRASVEDIAQNILDISSDGIRYIQVEAFVNHLLSIGDCVNISYTNRGFDTTDTFLVTAIEQSWENGLNNTISLVKQNGL